MVATAQDQIMVPPVRPPCHPPTAETAAFTPTRVCLRHPGYTTDNILLTLPAVDGTEARIGLHHRTLLTAGAIISGNTFSHAYLTRDRTARERVDITIPLDGLLEPGDYWLQVRGYELLVPGQTEDVLEPNGLQARRPLQQHMLLMIHTPLCSLLETGNFPITIFPQNGSSVIPHHL
jgi:hypothetical protein